MKSLYLCRHAKSSWTFDLPDHDRPLGKRGRKDVFKIGKHLSSNQAKPGLFISSTASRALYTALHVMDAYGLDEDHLKVNGGLYHASTSAILEIIQNAPECDTLAIFGHNPGFTEVVNSLANSNIDNIPTCGVAGIVFDVNKWSEVAFGTGKMVFFYYPKGI